MTQQHKWITGIVTVLSVAAITTLVSAQRGPGPSGKGRGPGFRGGHGDPTFVADRAGFHFLLANHEKIRREVNNRKDGVETLTESDDPKIAAKIQEHVAAMYKRVDEQRPIRMRDPLFRELFRQAAKINMSVETTKKGVRVVETSKDAYVARLIQEHAKVVSGFVKDGFAEAHKNHSVPGTSKAKEPAELQVEAKSACGNCRGENCQGCSGSGAHCCATHRSAAANDKGQDQ